jgi:hypothetical protein
LQSTGRTVSKRSRRLNLSSQTKSAFDGEAQFVEPGIKEALAPPFGLLPIARILFDVGLQSGIEDVLAIGLTVKARIQIEDRAGNLDPHLVGDSFKGFEPLGKKHYVHLAHRRDCPILR